MAKKDLLELKRRYKKNECTFTRVCGCYVNGEKNKITKIGETFLNLPDEEFYKYLEIAKKALSGTFGNNILELKVPKVEERAGGKQQFLLGLRDSKLKNKDLIDRFYDLIIDNYDYVGNYLILVFHDVYDVITKTSDNTKLDESEEVYEHLLCAICPVDLSKPGLGYKEDENKIGARKRDWVVGAPELGFLFPSFIDRSADIHSITYYVKDAKNSHADFVEKALGCEPKYTATEKQIIFSDIVKNAVGVEVEDPDVVITNIQRTLNSKIDEEDNDKEVPVTSEVIREVLEDNGINEHAAQIINAEFEKTFEKDVPDVKALINEKILKKAEEEQEKNELKKEVAELKEELGTTVKTYDVILRVKEEKEKEIKSQVIDGKKYILIPMDENDNVNINGSKKNI